MEIKIDTKGMTEGTVISINGKKVEGLLEFHFSMNPHRFKNGRRIIDGKTKMSMGLDGEFRSYFADDFRKFSEFVKPNGTAAK